MQGVGVHIGRIPLNPDLESDHKNARSVVRVRRRTRVQERAFHAAPKPWSWAERWSHMCDMDHHVCGTNTRDFRGSFPRRQRCRTIPNGIKWTLRRRHRDSFVLLPPFGFTFTLCDKNFQSACVYSAIYIYIYIYIYMCALTLFDFSKVNDFFLDFF